MLDRSELEVRVRNGAKVLDEMEPGWFERVNLEKLDMGSGQIVGGKACVMCQLSPVFGEKPEDANWLEKIYEVNAYVRGGSWSATAREHGFLLGDDEVSDSQRSGWSWYEVLDQLWIEEIESRRVG